MKTFAVLVCLCVGLVNAAYAQRGGGGGGHSSASGGGHSSSSFGGAGGGHFSAAVAPTTSSNRAPATFNNAYRNPVFVPRPFYPVRIYGSIFGFGYYGPYYAGFGNPFYYMYDNMWWYSYPYNGTTMTKPVDCQKETLKNSEGIKHDILVCKDPTGTYKVVADSDAPTTLVVAPPTPVQK